MEDGGDGDAFQKQRRNLIAISFFAILYRVLGLKVDKISVFGNSASVEAGSLFSALLLVLILYFSWRYTHYIKIVNAAEMSMAKFKESLRSNIFFEAAKYIKKNKFQDTKEDVWLKVYNSQSPLVFNSLLSCFKNIKFNAYCSWRTNTDSGDSFSSEAVVSWFGVFRSFVKSVYDMVLYRQYFSEFIFPYLFAMLSICELFHWSLVLPLADAFIPGYERPLR